MFVNLLGLEEPKLTVAGDSDELLVALVEFTVVAVLLAGVELAQLQIVETPEVADETVVAGELVKAVELAGELLITLDVVPAVLLNEVKYEYVEFAIVVVPVANELEIAFVVVPAVVIAAFELEQSQYKVEEIFAEVV